MVDGQVTARDTTMTFTCFIFFDMFNALSCRSLVSLKCCSPLILLSCLFVLTWSDIKVLTKWWWSSLFICLETALMVLQSFSSIKFVWFQTKSVLQINLLGNTTFLFAISASILSLFGLIYVPFLQTIFQTEALTFDDILMLVCLSSSVLLVDECFKLFLRFFVNDKELTAKTSEDAKNLIP